MAERDTWKLQDAKARLPEVIRRARAGKPQRVTVRGKDAVIVVDPERFEIHAKIPCPRGATLAGFIEESEKYRGVTEGIDFEPPLGMAFDVHPFPFDEDEK